MITPQFGGGGGGEGGEGKGGMFNNEDARAKIYKTLSRCIIIYPIFSL